MKPKIKFEPFHTGYERIFGKKPFGKNTVSQSQQNDGINRHQRTLFRDAASASGGRIHGSDGFYEPPVNHFHDTELDKPEADKAQRYGEQRERSNVVEAELVEQNNGALTPAPEAKEKTVKGKIVKEICPHCATKNLVQVSTWTKACKRCKFEVRF
jgi:hypothetical protein